MSKITIEHELLKSKNATFVALLNEVILWAEDNNISPEQIFHFINGFNRSNYE